MADYAGPTFGVSLAFEEVVADAADAGNLPDTNVITGNVKFTPATTIAVYNGKVLRFGSVTYPITNGVLTTTDGTPGISLAADDPSLTVKGVQSGITWRVTITANVDGGATLITVPDFDIHGYANDTIDLANEIPGASASALATALLVGPQGPAGPAGATGPQGPQGPAGETIGPVGKLIAPVTWRGSVNSWNFDTRNLWSVPTPFPVYDSGTITDIVIGGVATAADGGTVQYALYRLGNDASNNPIAIGPAAWISPEVDATVVGGSTFSALSIAVTPGLYGLFPRAVGFNTTPPLFVAANMATTDLRPLVSNGGVVPARMGFASATAYGWPTTDAGLGAGDANLDQKIIRYYYVIEKSV